MRQKYTNFKMEEMLNNLQPILQHRGKVGYVAARNTRILRDMLTEYFSFKDELIRKYGSPEMYNGKETGRITLMPDSPNFEQFNEEFEKIGNIEHEVELMELKCDDDVINTLSGEEMLNLEWMIED